MPGPLSGVRVLELGGIGPAPFAAMLLADMGATVLRIARPEEDTDHGRKDLLNRGKRGITLDLRSSAGRDDALAAAENADILVEGFRPGTAERLGLGPEQCLARNQRLVYGRMTGWGRTGPLSAAAGHDINYISIAGALHGVGPHGGAPVPPLAYVGDFGGGGMSFATGLLAALVHAKATGEGQVVDASILDGAALLTLPTRNFLETGEWREERGSNLLDGGAPFYSIYETRDAEYVSIGPLEPRFYAQLLELMEIEPGQLPDQYDRENWEDARAAFETIFRSKSRDEWVALLEGTDVCFAPVLTMREAEAHPHNIEHRTFITVDGIVQPAPTPRFSVTSPDTPQPLADSTQDSRALAAWGLAASAFEMENT